MWQRDDRVFLARRAAGATMVELMVALAIMAGMAAAVMALVLAAAREQRVGLMSARLFKRADLIESFITRAIRNIDGDDETGAVFGRQRETVGAREVQIFDFIDAARVQGRTVFYRHRGRVYPGASFSFDPDAHELIYDPNTEAAGDERRVDTVGQEAEGTFLDDVRFAMTRQMNGNISSRVVLVWFVVSDHGISRRSYRDTEPEGNTPWENPNWMVVERAFAVRLR